MNRRRFLKRAGWAWSGLLFVPSAMSQIAFTGNQQWSGPNAFGNGSPPASGGGGACSGGNDIALRGTPTSVIGTGTTATPTEPTGAATDDVLIALVGCANAATITLPTGWTTIYNGTASATFKYNLAWIRRTGSAPSYAFGISSSVYREVHVAAFSGVCTSGNPYEASADGGVTSSSNPNCPSVTTLTANAVVIAAGIQWNGSNTGGWGMPSGYTLCSDNTQGNDLVMSYKKVASPGAEDPAAYTVGIGTAATWQASIALKD